MRGKTTFRYSSGDNFNREQHTRVVDFVYNPLDHNIVTLELGPQGKPVDYRFSINRIEDVIGIGGQVYRTIWLTGLGEPVHNEYFRS